MSPQNCSRFSIKKLGLRNTLIIGLLALVIRYATLIFRYGR